MQKKISFHKVHSVYIFLLLPMFFGVISKKLLPCSMSWGFSPLFSSKNYLVVGLPFRSFIHFELIFTHGIRLRVQTYYFAGGYPVFLAPLVKRLSFLHWKGSWHPCQKSFDQKHGGYFGALCSIPFFYPSVFIPVPPCFDDCTFSTVSFEIRKYESPQFYSSFSRLFWLFGGPLKFHVNFKMSFSISAKNVFGIW